jgi:5-formyltetrahydrofolate cyclo-ligase
MRKAEIREQYKKMRTALTEVEKNRFDDLMLINFQSLDIPFVNSVLSYWPITDNKEVNTHLFTDYLQFINPGAIFLYPKSDFETNTIRPIVVNDDTEFKKNTHHIYEPIADEELTVSEIDLIIVPLIVSDKNGYRVGYGKGFYDKFLAGCRKDCIKIGLSYFEPIEAIEDLNEYDIPLNYCITPQNTYVF